MATVAFVSSRVPCLVLFIVLAACGSTDSARVPGAASSDSDASSSDSGASTDDASAIPDRDAPAAPEDARADDASRFDAGQLFCNQVLLPASPAAFSTSAAPMPTGAGGTLVDGHYEMTALIQHIASGADAGAPIAEKYAFDLTAGVLQAVAVIGQAESTGTYAVTTSGATLSRTETCGLPDQADPVGYTVAGAELRWMDAVSGFESVFVRK